MTDAAIERLDALLGEQSGWFLRLGSPFCERLLDELRADLRARGPTLEILAGHDHDRRGTLLPLRLVGSIHRLVLEGRAPALARHYPSVGGDGDAEGACRELRGVLATARDELSELVSRPVQTNEVGRSAALYCGFVWLSARYGLPLVLREIGASAGLNLRWDRFRFEAADGRGYGDPSSPVALRGVFQGSSPPFDVPIRVRDRAGCDRAPIDATTRDGELTLQSYVWTDQHARLALLRGAIDVAKRVPALVVRRAAIDWLAEELAEPRADALTVVYHSVVWQYIERDEREAIGELFRKLGRRAPNRVAWLRFEPPRVESPWFEVRVSVLPELDDRLVARATPHGSAVEWIG